MDGVGIDASPQHLDPRVRAVWSVTAAAPVGVVGVLAAVVAVVDQPTLAGAILVVAAAVAAVAVALARLAWRRWTWCAFDDALELRHGLVITAASLVPYHRIQQIDLHRGPLQRLLGVSSLVLRTAAATTDASLPGIAAERADALRHHLLRRAGVDDAV